MAFDAEKLSGILNQISMDLVMASPDNLVEVSELLGRTSELKEAFGPLESPLPDEIISLLASALTSLIREQVTDADKLLEYIGEGLSMLQELALALPVGAPFKGDIQQLKEKINTLIGKDSPFDSFIQGVPSADLVEDAIAKLPFEALIEKSQAETAKDATEDFAVAFNTAELQAQPVSPELRAELGNLMGNINWQDGGEEIAATTGQIPEEDLSLDRFKSEFASAVEQIQVSLVAIEQKADPVLALNSLVGSFQTIVSAASLLQLEEVASLAAEAEELVHYVATEQVPYSTGITDLLLKACGYLMTGLNHLRLQDGSWDIDPGHWPPPALATFSEDLWAARQGFLAPSEIAHAAPVSSGAAGQKPKKLGEILMEKGLISEGDLGDLMREQNNVRSVRLGDILLAEKLISEEELNDALESQKKEPDKKLGEILVQSGKLDHEQVERALKQQETQRETKLGEILVKSKIGAPDKVAAALREQKLSENQVSSLRQAVQTVKVETLKLDSLIDMVGELVIAQSLIVSNESMKSMKEPKLIKDLAQVSRITSELQRNAMSLRMVPIRSTFQKMNRLVRDLAHKFGKDVVLETYGDDTEIDRNMVESIYDPLVHMVRNSLDHGLEDREERLAAGKSPKGLVTLKAYHQGGNVVIELSDDGRGLNTSKVLAKALEKGLVAPNDNLSEQEIANLIFLPGFSTAQKVSDVSGRGVGMDVVKKSIEKLRGKVDFNSVFGQGSTLTIRLPLTLAIIDGMIVGVGEHRYILPTISINESFRPTPEDYFTIKNEGEMIKVRDHLLPLMRLDRIVAASGAKHDPSEALVVVIENENERRCLLVDEVLGKQEVVIKSLGESLSYVKALAGGTILGDGRVGLILDIGGLFDSIVGGVARSFSSLSADGIEDDWDMGG